MSSSSHHRRNPRRNCRTVSEDFTDLNKPVSTDKASILHVKETTVSQDLNTAELCGQRTTKKKKEKPRAADQSPVSSACLQNGLTSSKSHEPESTVPQKITTPECPPKRRGRKKKCIQPSEEEVAASKACADGLDNSVHNSCPKQHLSSPKTKGTRGRHSKKTQNPQTPSDVSTGLHTCTTLSPRHLEEISSCHTNGDCSTIPHTPKRGRGRPRTRPLLSSTPNSLLHPLSPKRAENSFTPHSRRKDSSLVKVCMKGIKVCCLKFLRLIFFMCYFY